LFRPDTVQGLLLVTSRYIVLLSVLMNSPGAQEEQMAPGPDLRVGDAERDAAAERLRENYAQGRLTLDEFNERLSAALAATTQRELSQLTFDLPHSAAPPAPLPQGASGRGWQGSGYQRGYRHRPRFLPVLLSVALIWLLFFTWLPFRLFPFPGKLAILLVVFGALRGLFRRIWRRGRF
jgi:hypothetical protein